MFNVTKLRRRPRQFTRLIGMRLDEFETLLEAVRVEEAQQRLAQALARPRRRAVGGGRPLKLNMEQRLLATLLYYRLHLTNLLLACLFELDESNIWRDRHDHLQPALEAVLPLPMRDHVFAPVEVASHQRGSRRTPDSGAAGGGGDTGAKAAPRKRIGTLPELLEAYPELQDICIDGTEQEVPKPQAKLASRQFYSGKSHCHTVKTQLTTARRLVLHVYGGCPGNVADIQLLKASSVARAIAQAPPAPDAARRVRLDRGYSGSEKLYGQLPGVAWLAAKKGTSRVKVTAVERAWNHVMVARQRIQIEQNIGHLKNWRVLSGLYRARVSTHEDTVAVVAGLHNYRQLGRLEWVP